MADQLILSKLHIRRWEITSTADQNLCNSDRNMDGYAFRLLTNGAVSGQPENTQKVVFVNFNPDTAIFVKWTGPALNMNQFIVNFRATRHVLLWFAKNLPRIGHTV